MNFATISMVPCGSTMMRFDFGRRDIADRFEQLAIFCRSHLDWRTT